MLYICIHEVCLTCTKYVVYHATYICSLSCYIQYIVLYIQFTMLYNQSSVQFIHGCSLTCYISSLPYYMRRLQCSMPIYVDYYAVYIYIQSTMQYIFCLLCYICNVPCYIHTSGLPCNIYLHMQSLYHGKLHIHVMYMQFTMRFDIYVGYLATHVIYHAIYTQSTML